MGEEQFSSDEEVYQTGNIDESVNEALRRAGEARRARGRRARRRGSKEEDEGSLPSVSRIQAEANVAADVAEWGECIGKMDSDLQEMNLIQLAPCHACRCL